jgi:hypothetical protein
MQYTRKLGFDQTPDYDWLRGLFAEALAEMNDKNDGIYDWMLLSNYKVPAIPAITNEKPIIRSSPKQRSKWAKFKSSLTCGVF